MAGHLSDRCVTALAIALVAGCASTRQDTGPIPPPPRASDALAYAAPKLALAAPVTATWNVRGEELDVTLLAPAERGPFPLIVYLPGLGESSAAGAAWRRAWAEAGYAVLSAQTRASGTGVWSAERARAFDFRTVALEHFSSRALPARRALVEAVVDEAVRRQRLGDSIEQRIDPTRIAVAGFDLGAMAAMAVAGQRIDASPASPLPGASPSAPASPGGSSPSALQSPLSARFGVRSVIALSPYADFSGMGVEARFRDIGLPVLSVTSPEDTDAYGLVTTAAVRRAPYQYMPPGRKYLLLLGAGPHSLLGGQDHPPIEREEARAARRADSQLGSDRGGARDPRAARSRIEQPAAASAPVVTRPDLSGAWATQLRNVQVVTIAYLDATVKDSPRAAEWLARDAQRWLEGSANLLSK
jgi:dienelactone hydrolase